MVRCLHKTTVSAGLPCCGSKRSRRSNIDCQASTVILLLKQNIFEQTSTYNLLAKLRRDAPTVTEAYIGMFCIRQGIHGTHKKSRFTFSDFLVWTLSGPMTELFAFAAWEFFLCSLNVFISASCHGFSVHLRYVLLLRTLTADF